jgi:CRP-like cAMP-binding protein
MISPELLRRQELFKDLSEGTLKELAGQTVLREFSTRSFIIQSGEPSDALLLLVAGQLQIISTSESGKEIGLNFIDEGDCFGEVGLIDGGPRSASVVAVTPAVVGFLAKEQALHLFHHNSVVAARIQQKLCQIIRSEVKARSVLSGSKAYARVFMVLSKHPKLKDSQTTQSPLRLDNIPSQAVIARMANVSRETVSRALSSLGRAGVIAKKARQIEITDPQIIHRLASGELEIEQLADWQETGPAQVAKPRPLVDDPSTAAPLGSKKRIIIIRHARKTPVD